MRLLHDLARAAGVEGMRDRWFAGEPINLTEGRGPARALRNSRRDPFWWPARTSCPKCAGLGPHARLQRVVRSGAWTGFFGQAIRAVVNIGIGSDSGRSWCARRCGLSRDDLDLHSYPTLMARTWPRRSSGLNPKPRFSWWRPKPSPHRKHGQRAQRARLVPATREGRAASPSISWRFRPTPRKSQSSASRLKTCSCSGLGRRRYSLWSSIGLSIALGIASTLSRAAGRRARDG